MDAKQPKNPAAGTKPKKPPGAWPDHAPPTPTPAGATPTTAPCGAPSREADTAADDAKHSPNRNPTSTPATASTEATATTTEAGGPRRTKDPTPTNPPNGKEPNNTVRTMEELGHPLQEIVNEKRAARINGTGRPRFYDRFILTEDGTWEGLEVKSGGGHYETDQRAFDAQVSPDNPAYVTLSDGRTIKITQVHVEYVEKQQFPEYPQ